VSSHERGVVASSHCGVAVVLLWCCCLVVVLCHIGRHGGPSSLLVGARIGCSAPLGQYFTLLHEFRQIPADSQGMMEFHSDSAGMVGISHSCGFRRIPSGIPGIFHGNSREIPMDSKWNLNGITSHVT